MHRFQKVAGSVRSRWQRSSVVEEAHRQARVSKRSGREQRKEQDRRTGRIADAFCARGKFGISDAHGEREGGREGRAPHDAHQFSNSAVRVFSQDSQRAAGRRHRACGRRITVESEALAVRTGGTVAAVSGGQLADPMAGYCRAWLPRVARTRTRTLRRN